LDRGDVERGRRQPPGHGRALSAEMAWAALLLASDEPERAAVAAGRERYASRVRAWLREHPLADHPSRLRSRAQSEEFHAHPAERARILARSDILAKRVRVAPPDLLGAILIKARSLMKRFDAESQREDRLRVLAMVDDPRALAVELRPTERRWIRDAEERLAFDAFSALDDATVRRARQALRMLSNRRGPRGAPQRCGRRTTTRLKSAATKFSEARTIGVPFWS
jgi:hypothetical protein